MKSNIVCPEIMYPELMIDLREGKVTEISGIIRANRKEFIGVKLQ